MTEKNKLLTILEKVLPKDIPAEIAVVTQSKEASWLRHNSMVQGSKVDNVLVQVRVEENGRVGEGTTNVFNLPSLRQAVSQARKGAFCPGPLVLSGSKGYRELSLASATLDQSPQDRASLLTQITDLAGRASLLIDGSLTANVAEIAVVNSLGVSAYTKAASAEFEITVSSSTGPGRGYGYFCHPNAEKLDVISPFLNAAAKCQSSDKQQPLPAGEYTVILEPAAVAGLMEVAAKIFFDGQAFIQQQTPISQFGEKLFSEQLTIWDDSLDSRGLQLPFDLEGTPKQRLSLVNRGIIQGVCLDNESAAILNAVSTGHSLPWVGTPRPGHLVVEAGNAMLDDMIASTKRGILVSRFDGISILDPLEALITGTTAGGTLLVENGKLTSALPDLRFVQNLVDALDSIEMTGDEIRLLGGLWKSFLVPALKLNNFTFLTGNTGQI